MGRTPKKDEKQKKTTAKSLNEKVENTDQINEVIDGKDEQAEDTNDISEVVTPEDPAEAEDPCDGDVIGDAIVEPVDDEPAPPSETIEDGSDDPAVDEPADYDPEDPVNKGSENTESVDVMNGDPSVVVTSENPGQLNEACTVEQEINYVSGGPGQTVEGDLTGMGLEDQINPVINNPGDLGMSIDPVYVDIPNSPPVQVQIDAMRKPAVVYIPTNAMECRIYDDATPEYVAQRPPKKENERPGYVAQRPY